MERAPPNVYKAWEQPQRCFLSPSLSSYVPQESGLPNMAARAYVILLLAAFALVAKAQPNKCVQLGGPLISTCSNELKYVESKYPLDSTSLPTDAQIAEWIKGIPAGLPSAACCKAATSFDTNKCACDPALPNLLAQVGMKTTGTGLQGVVKITGAGCKFTPTPCTP